MLCGEESDAAHIKSRGAGGDDKVENLLPLCRRHHGEQHMRGWPEFASKYPQVMLKLEDMGWQIRNMFGVMKLVRR